MVKTDNERYKSIEAEKIEVGTKYAFTISPQKDFGLVGIDYYTKAMGYMAMKINKLSNCDIFIYPELSKLGRLHFHGWIKIIHVLYFYLTDIKVLCDIGSFEIDTISEPDKWLTYVTKQNKIYEDKLIKSLNLPTFLTSKGSQRPVYNSWACYEDADDADNDNSL